MILTGQKQLSAQWVTDTIAESFYEDQLAEISLAIDASNQLYAIYVKKIPGGMIGIPQFQLWYSEKPNGNDWSTPEMISTEDESTLFQSIAVTPEGEVYVAYESDFDGVIVLQKADQEWMPVDLNIPELSGTTSSPYVLSDNNGKIHLAFSHRYYDEVLDQVIIEMAYTNNVSGEWETTVVPDSPHKYDFPKSMDVAEDGTIHLFSYNVSQTEDCLFYLTNRTEDESGWEKIIVEETLEMKNILGLQCSGDEVHLCYDGKPTFMDPAEISYVKIQEGVLGEVTVTNPEMDAEGKSFILDPDGKPVVAFLEFIDWQTGGLYLSVLEEDGFNETLLVEASEYPKDAFLCHDMNGDLQVMVSKGQWEPNIYLMHPYTGPQYFSVEFSIVNESGESVSDAVVTLDEQTHEAGDYVFTELVAGTYSYSIARQGYHTFEGEVTISDQDINLDIELATDYTGFETLPVHSLKLYPNPATDQVQVEAGREILSVRVYDITGRLMFSQEPGTRETMLSVSGMPVGIYILNIETAEGIMIRKLSVKR
jgi:hypothetical protein